MKKRNAYPVVTIAAAIACGTGLPDTGAEGGRCYPDHTCNDGLDCLSDRCVRWEADGWSDAADDPGFDGAADLPPDPTGMDNADGEESGSTDEAGFDEGTIADPLVDEADVIEMDGADGGEDDRDVPRHEACEADCEGPPDPCPQDLCHVPAGTFWMGSNIDDTQCPTNALDPYASIGEVPCHQVDVPEFWIDRFEVTVARYRAYLDAKGTGCTNPDDGNTCVPKAIGNWGFPGHEQHPVDGVTWYQARGFCQWEGKRLCSESEWEKAARGTDGRLYPWGNEKPSCDLAIIEGQTYSGCDTRYTFPVGSRPSGRSPYGVDDMVGNAGEFVQDWYRETYEGAPNDGSAREWTELPELPWDRERVGRGPSISSSFHDAQASVRSGGRPTDVSASLGFRCCTSVGP